jgi:hypothetical protein
MIESPVRERPTRERAKPRATERVETHHPVIEAPTDLITRFLELPGALVLAVLWLVGAAILGMCGTALYLLATTTAHLFVGV